MYKASTIYYTLSQVEIEILSFVFFFSLKVQGLISVLP